MDLRAIRKGCAQQLSTVEGLTGYDTAPGDPYVTAGIVFVDRIEYDQTSQSSSHELWLDVLLLASAGNWSAGEAELDELLSTEGDRSVKRALEGEASTADWGGVISDCHVARLETDSYELVKYAEKTYIAALLEVRVEA